ncbi:hypothetical protein PV726_46740 [Streptomyces europaeiscabiei]|uniref:hypothetical protein n=1 Tax=Streptomyces europaeiscabiei TaxID=146819 RepID=UPI0029B5632F|nr:hypothetical protein [Streptomyces europaeiscabiei]MDX3697564.1 hypothetical protein [Streptomyces europaeiscabiei]
MTTVLDDVSRLPADPSLISLAYHHEHPLQAFEFDDTLEIWTVTARIDADAAADERLAHRDVDKETLDAIQDVTVCRMSFAVEDVRTRRPCRGDELPQPGPLPHRRDRPGRRLRAVASGVRRRTRPPGR